jgi:hypothetical protein
MAIVIVMLCSFLIGGGTICVLGHFVLRESELLAVFHENTRFRNREHLIRTAGE